MKTPNYVYPWISGKKGLPLVLFLVMLSGILQFATFAMSQHYVISSLGVQPEDVAFALQMTYVGILFTLPVHFRLIRYFEVRSYLIFAIILGLVLGIACIYTADLLLFFVLRFLQGIVVCMICGSMLMMLSIYLNPEHRQIVAPSIFYGTILSSGVLIGLVFSKVVLDQNWKEVYWYLIAFQVLSLLLIVLVFSPKSGVKRYPLYQIDWTGSMFFLTAGLSLAYTLIYGNKFYWFEDPKIRFSSCLFLLMLLLYLFRSATVKRPLISISAFKYKKFWAGLILLGLYYGIKDSLNLIFGYTAGVLQWSQSQNMVLGIVNIAGVITFMFIAGKLFLKNKTVVPMILISGFATLLFYHLWMYHIFTPDLSFGDLFLPVFLQGAASGLIFVPIMIFILTSLPPNTGMTGLIVAAYVRFISALNVGAGFYNLQLYYNQFFKAHFLFHVTNMDSPVTERLTLLRQMFITKGRSPGEAESLAILNLNKTVVIQSQLLSNKAIFLSLSMAVGVILVGLIFWVCIVFFRSLTKRHLGK
jgi:DHA2 family multidrug resistance protein